MASQAIHIIAISYWIPSHALPLLQICEKLASLGHKITILRCVEYNSPLAVPGDGLNIVDLALMPAYGLGKFKGAIIQEQKFQGLGKRVKDAIERMMERDSSICCLMADVYVGWAPDVATQLGILSMTLWISCPLQLGVYTRLLPQLDAANIYPFNDLDATVGEAAAFEALRSSIPGLLPIIREDLDAYPQYTRKQTKALLEHFIRIMERIKEADCIIFNSFPQLDGGIPDIIGKHIPVLCVGPVSGYSDYSKDFHECLEWLDEQEASSVVYISFGTTMALSAEAMKAVAAGVEASNIPFLWAMPQSVIHQQLPHGFLDRTKDRGRIYSWVPQMRVLMHKSVGGFYTQGGWNSVTETVLAGVPMLSRPIASDQFLHTRLIVHLGIGLDEREFENPHKALRDLMFGEGGRCVRMKMREMGESARMAVAKGGSSYTDLLQIVKLCYSKCTLTSRI